MHFGPAILESDSKIYVLAQYYNDPYVAGVYYQGTLRPWKLGKGRPASSPRAHHFLVDIPPTEIFTPTPREGVANTTNTTGISQRIFK